jgi:hypothetical protein
MSAKKKAARQPPRPQHFAEDYQTTVRCLICRRARRRNVVGVREHTRTEIVTECPHCGRATRHTQTLD